MAVLVVSYSCPPTGWTKVASAVTSCLLQRGISVDIRVVVQTAGDAAPTDGADAAAGYALGGNDDWLPLVNATTFDVWVRPRGVDPRAAIVFVGPFA